MSKRIRVIARHHDPVVMNRLIRLLIAQAATELKQQEVAEGSRPPQTKPETRAS